MSELELFPEPTAADDQARERIAAALHDTLFVEAGAGSGKTTALVGRVVKSRLRRQGEIDGAPLLQDQASS